MFLLYLFIFVIIILFVDRQKPDKFVKLHKQLGSRWMYFPIIGNALNLIGSNEVVMKVLFKSVSRTFKSKHKAVSFWLGNIFIVGITDAEQAAIVLKSTSNKYLIHKFTKYLIGNGSVFAPVNIWHRRRKVLASSFASRNVNKYVNIFEANAKIVVERLQSKVGKGNVSCWDYVSRYALDSICETAFGVNCDMQRQPDHPFFNAFVECLKNMAARLSQPWLYVDAIYKLLPVYARQERAKKIIYDFVDNLISRKKTMTEEEYVKGEDIHESKSIKSFLELMIVSSKTTDRVYTDEELREETLVLALAGTDTSAVAICFTCVLLSQHPDVQDRVYNEIQDVLKDSNEPLRLEKVLKMKYTKAVIKETLRLYPPVPIITRYVEQDIKLPSGITIPEGCNVIIGIVGIHCNPEYWGKDANEFNPDRFLKEEPSNAFLPFSSGPRNCIGSQYAMLSMTITLVTLLRHYRFTPATNFKYDKKTPLRLSFDIMMKHIDGFTVQLEHRNEIDVKHINEVKNKQICNT